MGRPGSAGTGSGPKPIGRLRRRFRRANPLAGDAPRLSLRASFVLFSVLFVALLAVATWYFVGHESTQDLRRLHDALVVLVPAEATILGFLMAVNAIIVGQTRARTDRHTAPGAEIVHRIAALRVQPLLSRLHADYVEQLERHGALPADYRRAGMSAYPDPNVVRDLALLDRVADERTDPPADSTSLLRVAYTVLLSPAVRREYATTRVGELGDYVADVMRDHDLVRDVDAVYRVRRGSLAGLLGLLSLVVLWLVTVLVVTMPFAPEMRAAYVLVVLSPFAAAWTAAYYMYQLIAVYMAGP